ncbi:MAG: hypothetical protein C4326_06365 [Ignavibacteria bacterium]
MREVGSRRKLSILHTIGGIASSLELLMRISVMFRQAPIEEFSLLTARHRFLILKRNGRVVFIVQ